MKLRLWLLPLLLSSAVGAGAQVYKWVDEQGEVHYGDLPPGGAASEPVKLPGLSTYSSPPVPATPAPQPAPPAAFAGYTRVEIVQPEPGSAVRANDQRVVVAVALEPHLQEGHAIEILVDGNAVGEPFSGTTVELTGVYRGQHSLRARVVDETGKRVAESAPISFTLRQISIIRPAPARP